MNCHLRKPGPSKLCRSAAPGEGERLARARGRPTRPVGDGSATVERAGAPRAFGDELLETVAQAQLCVGKGLLGEVVFPDTPDGPAIGLQDVLLNAVSLDVACDLRLPVLTVG